MASQGMETADLAERSEVSSERVELFLEAEAEPGVLEFMRLSAALLVEPTELLIGLAEEPDSGEDIEASREDPGRD